MSKLEMSAYLKMLAAVAAAEDLLSELKPFDEVTALLQNAMSDAEAFLPPSSYAGIEQDKLAPFVNEF